MKKLTKKLMELQKKGYETVTIEQVLAWIRYFTPYRKCTKSKK